MVHTWPLNAQPDDAPCDAGLAPVPRPRQAPLQAAPGIP